MAEKDTPPRLTKSAANRVFAGVAGGLGEYFNVDPTLVRLLFVIATFWGGTGFIAYIALAILMPENPNYRPKPVASDVKVDPDTKSDIYTRPGFWIGAVLLAIGTLTLLDRLNVFQVVLPPVRWDIFWPIVLILFGIWFLARK